MVGGDDQRSATGKAIELVEIALDDAARPHRQDEAANPAMITNWPSGSPTRRGSTQ